MSCRNKAEITVNQVPMKWHYDVPATKYWEGLPIGTGRFAAMIPGNTDTEVIAFNDETLYTGGPYNPNPANGPKTLKKVRELIFARDYVNADAVTLILAGATNWVNWNDVSADEKQRCGDYISNASKFSYGKLLKRHLDDYCPLFAACKLNLGDDPHKICETNFHI
ncbi:MAG: glycoside hydrolase family 95 protein [Dysgonamonadaceae bacterium]|jgi:hypothetical protein|nr:glycoside hydrolase family 95 protein [Dysgonamonadaceae bacterium]